MTKAFKSPGNCKGFLRSPRLALLTGGPLGQADPDIISNPKAVNQSRRTPQPLAGGTALTDITV